MSLIRILRDGDYVDYVDSKFWAPKENQYKYRTGAFVRVDCFKVSSGYINTILYGTSRENRLNRMFSEYTSTRATRVMCYVFNKINKIRKWFQI